jgi:hypothetical protein
VADGYVAGATVFADANGTAIYTTGDATTTTDTSGNFTLTAAVGPIYAYGGTDLGTGKPFVGVLSAPAGSSEINPLTTLQQVFVARGQTPAQAAASVGKALGFDASQVNLQTFDILGTALNSSSSTSDIALATQLQADAAKLSNLIVTAASTLSGAAGTGNLSTTDAANAVLQSLADGIGNASGAINLSDPAFLQTVLNGSVAHANNAA